jgi:NAD/NADP transhydrogenase beta subunit
VTFSGSIIAAGKLQGFINGAPVTFPGSRAVNAAAAAIGLGASVYLIVTPSVWVLLIVIAAALGFGVTMVMPIGGADMPVVISLLNAFTGTAVAMAGFVIGNWALIVAGALVGASGSILTKLMADAMNRSLANIMIGGFGTGDTADVALVIGANDVTNPAARRPGNPISGMPILDVDHAKSIIVIKRSMGHGYAGLDNDLYVNPKTSMYFADAKTALTDLIAAVKAFVA